MSLGIVYVLSNPALPGILKIGITERPDTDSRIRELSKSTAIPLPFELEFDQIVENPKQWEALLHARFREFRVSPDKEFFRIDTMQAISEINLMINGTSDFIEAMMKQISELERLAEKYPKKFKGDWSADTMRKKVAEGIASLLNE